MLRTLTLLSALLFLPTVAFAVVCPAEEKPGQYYNCDSETGRWVIDEEYRKFQLDSQNDCGSLAAEAKETCLADKAREFSKSRVEDNSSDTSKKNVLAKVAKYTSMAALATIAFKDSRCQAPSSTLIAAGAAVNAGGDVWAWLKHHNGSKKMADEYAEYTNGKTTSDAQKKAFIFLADEQALVSSVAKIKAYGQTAAAALYTAATIVALTESIPTATATTPPCATPTDIKSKLLSNKSAKFIMGAAGLVNTAPLFFDNAKEKNQRKDLFKGAHLLSPFTNSLFLASLWKHLAIGSAHAQAEVLEPIVRMVPKKIKQIPIELKLEKIEFPEAKRYEGSIENTAKTEKTPYTRAIISGVLAGATGYLASHSFKVAEISRKRASDLRKIAKKFATVENECSADDLKSPTNERCYCWSYNQETGNHEPRSNDRSNSDICKKSWDSGDYFFSATDYSQNPYLNGKGCITNRGGFDKVCSCRKIINPKTGLNNCKKIQSKASWPKGLSTSGFITDAMKRANSLMSGAQSYGSATMGEISDMIKSNARAKRLADKISAKLDKALMAKGSKPLQATKRSDQMAMKLAKSSPTPQSSFLSSSSLSGDNSFLPQDDLKKIQEAAQKSGVSISAEYDSSGKAQPTGKKDDAIDFGFGDLDAMEEDGSGNAAVMDVMKKDFNYGENDISKRKDDSIFKILSGRYMSSGLRRLFE